MTPGAGMLAETGGLDRDIWTARIKREQYQWGKEEADGKEKERKERREGEIKRTERAGGLVSIYNSPSPDHAIQLA
jgi:hypothetical protein